VVHAPIPSQLDAPDSRHPPRLTDAVSYAARAHARADGRDFSHRLVAEHARKGPGQFPFGLVDVRKADSARADSNQYLVRPGFGSRDLLNSPLFIRCGDDGSLHVSSRMISEHNLPRAFRL